MTVADIQNRDDLQLVTDEIEVLEIIKNFGNRLKEGYFCRGIFVAQKDGEYTEILGFTGNIPELKKELIKKL